MGCDIHAYLEVRRYKHDDEGRQNGIWVNADKWTKSQYAVLYPEDKEREWEIRYDDRIWTSRWYYLFAILADVRNAWDLTPISEPKGFPLDASDEVKEEREWWGRDGHSDSWLTLSELENWSGWSSVTDELRSDFNRITIERMKAELGHRVTEFDVRMVFWFDN